MEKFRLDESAKALPTSEFCPLAGSFGPHLMTADNCLVSAIELSGIDPSALTPHDHLKTSLLVERIFASIDPSITVTQYLLSIPCEPIRLKQRANPLHEELRRARQEFLSTQELLATRIVHFFSIKALDASTGLNIIQAIPDIVRAPFSGSTRKRLRGLLSASAITDNANRHLSKAAATLSESTENACGRWSLIMQSRILGLEEMVKALSVVTGLRATSHHAGDPTLAHTAEHIPGCEIYPIQLRGLPAIKYVYPDTQNYARIASFGGFGSALIPALFGAGKNPPGMLPIPYMIALKTRQLNAAQSALLFEIKRKDVERRSVSFASLLSSAAGSSTERENLSTRLRQKMQELDTADALQVRWTKTQGLVVAYHSDPDKLLANVRRIDTTFGDAHIPLLWEGPYRFRAMQTISPAKLNPGLRAFIANSPQVASATLVHSYSRGQPKPEAADEPLAVLATRVRSPFHYHPQVDGRGLVLGIGPTRSGKTYLKNTVALGAAKYGGSYYCIDVDAGTEPLAELLESQGAVFRLGSTRPDAAAAEQKKPAGFNLFHSSLKEAGDDSLFHDHILNQLRTMYAAGGVESLTADDFSRIDQAIGATNALPVEMRSLGMFVSHLPENLAKPLYRWIRSPDATTQKHGMWSTLTDAESDRLHSEAPFQVFNLAALKDSPAALSVAYSEIFYRISRRIESEAARSVPKFLDIDEAHIPLQYEPFQQWITRGARTWNKYQATISLWTQSVEELLGIQFFHALRSAISTFIFTAYHDLPEKLMMDSLALTAGECDAIRSLQPRREIYVIQRDAGVSQTVLVDNDDFCHTLIASNPELVALRNKHVRQLGIVEGVRATVRDLRSQQPST